MNYDKIPNEIFDEARGIVALEGGWAEVKLKHGKRVLDELIKESLNREIQIIMNDPELMNLFYRKNTLHSLNPQLLLTESALNKSFLKKTIEKIKKEYLNRLAELILESEQVIWLIILI